MNIDKAYPRFLRRLQAVAIDSIILAVIFMSMLLVAAHFGVTGRDAVILTAVIVVLWEPCWVSITGGSIGHHLIGLKVVSSVTGDSLNIFASLLRFISKMLLGNVSVVFIFITRYHQAIHDGLARSVVLIKHPETKPDYEVLAARIADPSLPSVLRRSIMIVIYNGLLILIIGMITGLLLPAQCLVYSQCTISQDLALTFWQLLWVVGIIAIIVFCWQGRLFGCRRSRIKEEQ